MENPTVKLRQFSDDGFELSVTAANEQMARQRIDVWLTRNVEQIVKQTTEVSAAQQEGGMPNTYYFFVERKV